MFVIRKVRRRMIVIKNKDSEMKQEVDSAGK